MSHKASAAGVSDPKALNCGQGFALTLPMERFGDTVELVREAGMTLLLFCATGWALGLSVNVFGLGLALFVTAFAALLMKLDVGLAAGLWSAVSVTAWLQIGYVVGIASRLLTSQAWAMRPKGPLRRPRG
jgi:hypothetical protein